jgi:hypothetical protein
MKTTHHSRKDIEIDRIRCEHGISANRCAVGPAVARAKQEILNRYFPLFQEHANVLRLALNEAEALAWQTSFPHLFFPELAMEKAQAAIRWHQRQRGVRRGTSELAFAE